MSLCCCGPLRLHPELLSLRSDLTEDALAVLVRLNERRSSVDEVESLCRRLISLHKRDPQDVERLFPQFWYRRHRNILTLKRPHALAS